MTPQEGLSVGFVVTLFVLSMKRVHARMKDEVRTVSASVTPLAAVTHFLRPIWMDMALTIVLVVLAGVLVNAGIESGGAEAKGMSASPVTILGGAFAGLDALYAMNLALSSTGILAFWYTLWLRIKNASILEYRTMLDVLYGFTGVILPVLYLLRVVVAG